MLLTIDELRVKRDQLTRELESHQLAVRTSTASGGMTERIENLAPGIARVDAEIADAERRLEHVRELAKDPRHCEEISESHHERNHSSMKRKTDTSPGAEARNSARRAIDKAYERGDLPEPAGFMLTDLVERDKFGLDAQYIDAVSSPAYEKAFAKKLTGVDGAEGVLEPAEAEAMQKVGRAMATRAMAVGEGSTGGYAVPLTLDPTILLTNDGAVNPIRELATVSQISTTHWRGVSSTGVKAEFAKEATEAEDASPTLGDPEITPERASIWIPFSFEAAMDWPGLANELGKLFRDAKSVKEAEAFVTGEGKESVPEGLITGATKTVETATKEVLATGDIYATQDALAPRWQPNASWLMSLSVANIVHRFIGGGSEEPSLFNPDMTKLLAKPWSEVSTMSSKASTKKEKIVAYGDIASAYRIVDRLGMVVEPVPMVFGESGAPTGQRGLFAWFRVGAKVIVPEAVQVLVVKE